MSDPKPKLETFIANAPWVAGQRVEPGSEVKLTAKQAQYEPVSPKPAAASSARRASPKVEETSKE